MKTINPKTDWFFEKDTPWKESYGELRKIALSASKEMSEELKWGGPCYTFGKNNVVLIHGFKHYCAFLFMKGALLKDEHGILVQQTANVQSARQIRFSNISEIIRLKEILKAYIREAIEIEKSGKKLTLKKTEEYEMPPEFNQLLNEMPEVKEAFYQLTPGRQRGYLLYFSSAKQEKTRMARIEKYVPVILKGKGIDD